MKQTVRPLMATLPALALLLAGLPALDPAFASHNLPEPSLDHPAHLSDVQEEKRELASQLLTTLEDPRISHEDRAMASARTAIQHREAPAQDGELDADALPMLDRQRANLDLSENLLAINDDPDLTEAEKTLAIAERAIEDRQAMAEDSPLLSSATAPGLSQQQTNIDTARTILEEIERGQDGTLSKSLALAQLATRHQAENLEMTLETPEPTNDHRVPSEAVEALVDRYDVTLTPDDRATVERLDDFPEPTRAALTGLLEAFLVYDRTVKEAYADANLDTLLEHTADSEAQTGLLLQDDAARLPKSPLDPAEADPTLGPRTERAEDQTNRPAPGAPMLSLAEHFAKADLDLEGVLSARSALLDAAMGLRQALGATGPAATMVEESTQLRLPPALAIDLDREANTYEENYALLLDVGGDDAYPNNAGGSNLLHDNTGFCHAMHDGTNTTSAAALFDLGNGDDDYTSPKSCGVRGGGYLGGSGLLVDEGGNDTFTAYPEEAYTPPSTVVSTTATPDTAEGDVLDLPPDQHSDQPTPDEQSSSSPRYIVGLHQAPERQPGDTFHGTPILDTSQSLRFLVVEPDKPEAFLDAAQADPDVRYVEEDGPIHLDHEPSDPRYDEQYGLEHIRTPEAWDTSLGDASRSVCMVDTGIDYTHPDFEDARYLGGYDFASDSSPPDENNDADPYDERGHGTHVAGIAGATVDNAEGIAGVGNIGLLAAKIWPGQGAAYASDGAQGIQWCADQGGDVISMSWTVYDDFQVIEDAIHNASAAGSLLVTSAGNTGSFNSMDYPALYDEVMAVTSTNQDGQRSWFSSYGPDAEIAAPGNDILSTAEGGGYELRSGTSMSTPYVAGVAALAWSQAEDLTNDEVRQLLRDNAQEIGPPGCDERFGHGIVDANATLHAVLDGDRPAYEGVVECMSDGWFGANGGGYAGTGLLVAAGEGDDVFIAGGRGTNGGGAAGIGSLVSEGGSNTYAAYAIGTNGGASTGSGLLVDAGGDDEYEAGARGVNGGGTSQSIGFLFDAGGQNTFTARHEGTNGGANAPGAAGFLFDAGTADTTYNATFGGTNGGGQSYGGVGLLLDVDGDDSYAATLGATNGGAYVWGAGFLVDDRGDDTYTAEELGTNGGSFGHSAGFLMDGDGDDTYTATERGTNGAGFGTASGFLLDAAGNNTYEATSVANGGAASSVIYFGASGFLFDAGEGDSVFTATNRGANGGGFIYAAGLLLNAGGNNTYTATDRGVNGGGVGWASSGHLIEAGTGATHYEATSDGTNGGGWAEATGTLVDAGGHDTYTATHRATNGGAQRDANGFLFDLDGDDIYTATDRATNGGGVDLSVGTLIDWNGNDIYTATHRGANGGAFAAGDGMLLDRRGDDTYNAGECGTNGGADDNCIPPLVGMDAQTRGLLIDSGGSDTYDDDIVTCEDCTHAPKGGAGAQIDGDAGLLWEAIEG